MSVVTGASTVEELIPGNPAAITAMVEQIAAGAEPARQVGEAWQTMRLPDWTGVAGNAWRTVTQRETAALAGAPGVFRRVAAALQWYEDVFRAARSEAQAAISEAYAAERATAQARAAHERAVERAKVAPEDSPDARVDPFVDPGVQALASAQARYVAARAYLDSVGNEVAGMVRAAAGTVSGVAPSVSRGGVSVTPVISLPPKVIEPDPDRNQAIADVLEGVVDGAAGVVGGVLEGGAEAAESAWKLLPFQFMIDEPDGWGDAYEDHWKSYGWAWAALRTDPFGTLWHAGKDMVAAEMWGEDPARAAGHVIFNFGSLFVGGVGLLKVAERLPALRKFANEVESESGEATPSPVPDHTVTPKGDVLSENALRAEPPTKAPFAPPLNTAEIDALVARMQETPSVRLKKDNGLVQTERQGGYDQALKDFDELTRGIDPAGIKVDLQKGTRYTVLSDGTEVNVRMQSKHGDPTLELVRPPGKSDQKFRYKE